MFKQNGERIWKIETTCWNLKYAKITFIQISTVLIIAGIRNLTTTTKISMFNFSIGSHKTCWFLDWFFLTFLLLFSLLLSHVGINYYFFFCVFCGFESKNLWIYINLSFSSISKIFFESILFILNFTHK